VAVLARTWRRVLGGVVAEAAQFPGMALDKSPCAMTLVVAAEFVALRRMIAGSGAIAHGGQLGLIE
jgi:hypothetical protein